MKTFLLILLLYSPIVFSQTNIQAGSSFSISVSGSGSVYKATDTTVCKLDSLGNSIWVKDFGGHIMDTSVFRNRFTGFAFDGSFLYLQEDQSPWSYLGHHNFPAMIVLDTNGNVVSIRYQYIAPGGSHFTYGCAPSLKSGAWFFDDFVPGFTHHAGLCKIDSTTGWKPSKKLWFYFQTYTMIESFIPLPDSTYLITIFSYSPSGGPGRPSLIKINENGNPSWLKTYHTSAAFEMLDPLCTAADSSGNIYLMLANNLNTIDEGACLLKINSSGNIVTNRLWHTLIPPQNGNSLIFKNNELIFFYGNNEIHFDTLLNNRCLGAGTTRAFSILNESYDIDTNYIDHVSNFTPVNGAAVQFNLGTVNYPDYCNVLEVPELISDLMINIFPNPAIAKLHIHTEDNIAESMILSLYDLTGRLVFRKQLSLQEEQLIDISKIASGIYLVEILIGVVKINKKIVIEN